MRKTARIILLALLFLGAAEARQNDTLLIGAFSQSKNDIIPGEWKPLAFKKIKKHTRYSVVTDEGARVIKAESNGSASGLICRKKIDIKEYPVIKWRWKVTNILKNGDVTKKEGDDYPARIYITFAYDPSKAGFFERTKYEAIKLLYGEYPPSGALNYIWESKAPVGTIVPNPYTDRVIMIVVESGPENLNKWMNEERNVYDDYKRAFGAAPSPISGVAIMTDTDNTGESAISFYGDIAFAKGEQREHH